MFIKSSRKHLPFFPIPYPDECLYSVISRYHMRSANPTLKESLQDLFHTSGITSISSSITTPYHLSLASKSSWKLGEIEYTKEQLVRKQTAYQFYTIRRTKRMMDMESTEDPELVKPAIQHTLIHESRKMRYCPCCAKEQRIVYGEPYWQRLPQLKGAEYCPIHARPYLNSNVDVKFTATRAVTAAFALLNTSTDSSRSVNPSVSSNMEEFYIRNSKDMLWLLNNGYQVQGIEKTLQIVAKSFGFSDCWGRRIKEIALAHLSKEYVNKTFPCFRHDGFSFNLNIVGTITPHQTSILMGLAGGSAEKFATM